MELIAKLTLAALLLLSAAAGAQDTSLYVIADVWDGAVAIRFAPASAPELEAGRRDGYRIVRRTLAADGSRGPETVLEERLRPDPLPLWESRVDTSDFAAVLAEMLYGEVETVADPELNGEQSAMRFGLTLYAADHDFGAARAAALGYLDATVDTSLNYEYTVSRAGDSGAFAARITVDAGDRRPPPPPQLVRGYWDRREIEVSWHRARTERHYTSYAVERWSDAEQRYQRLNPLPLVQILNAENYDTLQYFRDEAVSEELNYEYRVIGTTPFGRYGPPSEPVLVRSPVQPLVGQPRIQTIRQIVDTLFRIDWAPAEGNPADLAGYRVAMSDKGYEDYVYRSDLLPPGTTTWAEPDPRHGMFYRVEAIDVNGRSSYSPAKLMLVEDTRPPAAPRGLAGRIDTTGRVLVTWDPNDEPDLAGYRVYVANRPEGYFPQLTAAEWPDNFYVDQVTMDTRAERVYYKVRAIDLAGNYSAYSPVLTLERPDLRPPTPPVVREVSGSTAGVRLDVALSSSDDVAYHLLQRAPRAGGDFVTLDTLRPVADVTTAVDTTGERGEPYRYRIVAVDDAELRSASRPVEAERTDNGLRGTIEAFTAQAAGAERVAVSWRYGVNAQLRGFQLYRAEGDGRLVAYRLLAGDSPNLRFRGGTFTYYDPEVTPGDRYTYQLMAVHHDGGYSPLTPTLSVTLP